MKAVQDFNYKVALASGLKHLQGGKLRQAEEQFRYLVRKFPRADGGYRGLARVQLELDDRAAALTTLRDGAAALAKTGDRIIAIDLLREATQLDPLDLSSHRRLAATLALAGDVSGAAEEYVRFANAEIAAGDPERARLEASYAIETFGELPKLHELARAVGLELQTVRAGPRVPEPEAAPLAPAAEADLEPEPDIGPAPEPWPGSEIAPAAGPEPAPELAWDRPAPEPEAPAWPARPPAAPTPAWDRPAPEADAPAWPARPQAAPTPALRVDALELEARATQLIGARDPEAGRAAVEAAAALREAGKLNAASDLLLQLVALGIDVHEAERELIAVAHELGRTDIAQERARLLTQASRLG